MHSLSSLLLSNSPPPPTFLFFLAAALALLSAPFAPLLRSRPQCAPADARSRRAAAAPVNHRGTLHASRREKSGQAGSERHGPLGLRGPEWPRSTAAPKPPAKLRFAVAREHPKAYRVRLSRPLPHAPDHRRPPRTGVAVTAPSPTSAARQLSARSPGPASQLQEPSRLAPRASRSDRPNRAEGGRVSASAAASASPLSARIRLPDAARLGGAERAVTAMRPRRAPERPAPRFPQARCPGPPAISGADGSAAAGALALSRAPPSPAPLPAPPARVRVAARVPPCAADRLVSASCARFCVALVSCALLTARVRAVARLASVCVVPSPLRLQP